MSGAQHGVLWLGLLLIAVRLLTGQGWDTFWGTLKGGSGSGGSGSTPSSSPTRTPATKPQPSQPVTNKNPAGDNNPVNARL